MTRDLNKQIARELESIRRKGKGILRPVDVVSFAKDPSTALHARFDWDDSSAAHRYRLWQARELIIRVKLTVLPNSGRTLRPDVRVSDEHRAYASLKRDQLQPDGGYRYVVDVLASDELRAELLKEALEELQSIRQRYNGLKKLAAVFAAVDEVAA